ncbi:unnamed protein product [Sympodiomycopsis kandeliae]
MELSPSTAASAAVAWLPFLRLAQPALILVALTWTALSSSNRNDPHTQQRRKRTRFISATLLTLLLSYFISGTLLVLRAVIPSSKEGKQPVWTPNMSPWKNVDYQIILCITALSLTLILLAWQQKHRGIGNYSISPLYNLSILGAAFDVAIIVLYGIIASQQHHKDIESTWSILQIVIQAARIVVLWPLLSILAYNSFNGQQQQQQQQSNQSDENTSLLSSATTTANQTNYGSAAPPQSSSSAANANASMGLTVSNDPPPPTFRVFAQRIVMLFPYLWPKSSIKLQLLALLAMTFLILGRLVNLAVPLTLGRIVDHLADTKKDDNTKTWSVWWLIAGYGLLKSLQGSGGLISAAQAFSLMPLRQYSDRQMSLMAFRHLLDLSMSFHTKRKTGEVLRILDRGGSISDFFIYLIFSMGPIFFDVFIATAFLSLTFGPQVGLLLFAVMTFYTAISIKMTAWRTPLRRAANNKDSISRAIHTDVLLNWETVKSYNNEDYELQRYRLSLLDYQRADWKVMASMNVLNLTQNLTLSLGTLLMLFVVAYDVVHGHATSSDFVVFISYLAQIYGPLNMLSTMYRVIQTSLVDTDKLIALLGEEKDVKDVPDAKDLQVERGTIEFRNVKFSYDGKVEALKGLNFTIKPQSKVALVGESGAGKSSILRLLYRFYDPSSGEILIDGQDIRQVSQHSLRRAIGVVPQEAGLLNTSIKTNIGYGRTDPSASDEEIDAAASAAQILDRIRSFPEGMDTVVGERGVRLSGGEKQRVAIARTFLKAPPILLLDEATSALDSHTEKQLQSALETLMQGKTSLTIAHRLSTIVNSDQIIVLNDGIVVENGTHEELLEIPDGRYRGMWMSQIQTDKERQRLADNDREEKEDKKEEMGALGVIVSPPSQAIAPANANVNAQQESSAVTETHQGEVDKSTSNSAGAEAVEEVGKVGQVPSTHTIHGQVLDPVSEASVENTPDHSSVTQQEDTPDQSSLVGQEEDQGQSVVSDRQEAERDQGQSGVTGQEQRDVPSQDTTTDQTTLFDSDPRRSPISTRQPSLSRQSTHSISNSIGGASSTTTTNPGSGSGRMRQRFASLIRRSTSGSGSGTPTGEEEASGNTSPTMGLKRSLSLRSNGKSSPRLNNDQALPSSTPPPPTTTLNGAQQPQTEPAISKPISTSGVSAGAAGKKKKGKKGRRK